MEVRLKLSKSSSSPPVDATLYRSLVESLQYLVHTRPDLAYSVGYVSRFMEAPCEEHLVTIKRILRLCCRDKNIGCSLHGREEEERVAMSVGLQRQ